MAGRRRIYLLLTLISLFTLPLLNPFAAQESGKTGVEILGPSFVEARPREVVTLSFLVTNSTPAERVFLETIDLPEGWKLLFPMTTFPLKGGENEVRLVSIIVPPTAAAGKYTVTYLVKDASYPFVRGYTRVEVNVLPLLNLEAITQEAPLYATAGESYEVSFQVINRGNAPVRVTIEIECEKGFPATVEEKEFLLEAGQSRVVKVMVQTRGDLVQAENHILRFKAKTQDPAGKVVEAIAVSSVEVIPRVSGVLDRYHRIPVILSIESYRKGGNLGLRGDLVGAGSLDEAGETKVDFSLRGTLLEKEELSSELEDSRLSLAIKGLTIHLGDRLFGLSSLTERDLFGRGAEISFKTQGLRMGGYYLKTLDNSGEERAGYLAYHAGDRWKLQINGISEKESVGEGPSEDRIWSLEMEGRLGKNTVAELEYAWGEREETSGRAWRGILSGEYHGIGYSSSILYADPGYPGEFQDVYSGSLSLSLPLKNKWRVWGNYREEQQNPALAPGLPDAPRQRWIEGGDSIFGENFFLSILYRLCQEG
ncbi:MAG: COG1470 family protein [Bacillota bacterium]